MKSILFLLFIGIAAISCTKNPINPVPPGALKSITLSTDSLNIYVGETKQLIFTLNPSNFNTKSLVFTSSDTTVVSVSNIGLLTAKKLGFIVITVAYPADNLSVTCLVTVAPKSVNPVTDSLNMGLIAFYPFTNASAVDSSGNGNDGTIYNLTAGLDRFNKKNSSFYFEGDSYIDIKDTKALRLSNTDFTINYWVSLSYFNNYYFGHVFAKSTGAGQNGWAIALSGQVYGGDTPEGSNIFSVSAGSDPFALSNTQVPIGNWAMVTITYNLSKQTISFYKNGVLTNSVTGIPTPNPNTSTDLIIGKGSFADPINNTPPYLRAALDDIRIYNRSLSATDIQKLYNLTH